MSAEIFRFPDLTNPTVYVLSGRSGSGKTRLLSHYADRYPLELSYHLPMTHGERFQTRVNFWETPIVAIDELLEWHQGEMPRIIRDLERQALARGGKLILVLRDPQDFLRYGYSLARSPVHIGLNPGVFSPMDLERLPAVPARLAQNA